MNDLLRLGQRIHALRNQKGWSQEEFADVCGVHRTYMGHLERGEKNVSFRSLVRVANALGVTLSTLFSGLEHEEQTPEISEMRRGRSKLAASPVELDRGRVLKAVAALERAVRDLKQVALKQDRPTSASVRFGKRKRPNA